ncbi:hypothetical protein [Microbacterium elymi]|uniref:Uncharacterized protein n=1 Tax=Microbacterium elymi TaxID=2909587 RepID=A0ABY5NH95_9MICO|nr:hypothetical protein [Microbacterium elymi]UUT34501.1 hypothetical protein L2X98_28535 [Microbacterium elymi]
MSKTAGVQCTVGPAPEVTRLNAMRVPSGESEGHSTVSMTDRSVRFLMSPLTRYVCPTVVMPTVA